MIPLSAKDQDRLNENVNNLVQFIQHHKQEKQKSVSRWTGPPPHYISQTLLSRSRLVASNGRTAGAYCEVCCGMEDKLSAYLSGHRNIDSLYLGSTRRNQDSLSVFMADEIYRKRLTPGSSKANIQK